ncbi:MAG TPA: dephospho-CoA kinase [Pseudomonadales bacterium]
MFVVGITGGIGSGKSAVSDRFKRLGIKIVDADIASREVVKPGQPALLAIRDHFGSELIQADGTLDRAALRARVFADPNERKWLERLLHPSINAYLARELASAESPYAVLVSPLLVETTQIRLVDRVLVVDVPEQTQIERTMARDSNSESQVKAIMAAQASRAARLERAHDVVTNDAGFDALDKAVAELHQRYLELARDKRA